MFKVHVYYCSYYLQLQQYEKNNGNTNESNKNKVGINMKHLIYWFRKKVKGLDVGSNPGRKIKSHLSSPLHQGILDWLRELWSIIFLIQQL